MDSTTEIKVIDIKVHLLGFSGSLRAVGFSVKCKLEWFFQRTLKIASTL